MFKVLSLSVFLFAGFAFQVQKRTCDHPGPPEGMHYVCAPQNTCDCHLERDRSEDGQSDNDETSAVTSATPGGEPCSASDLKYFVAPAYPAAARQARKQGTVTAHLVVDTSGTATIKIESGDTAFSEQVVTTLKKWRFAPSGSQKTVTATFTFALAGDPSEHMGTTVSGRSPLNMVITATPPLR
jgi:TonB family protein